MPRRFRLPAVALVALLACFSALAAAPAGALTGARSGLPWASGAYVPGDRPAGYEAFGAWRGAPVDVAVTWLPRRTWSDLTGSGWLFERYRTSPHLLVVGVPPIPEDGTSSLGACAAGAYDATWTRFGTVVAASGVADRTVIRLGWEFNGDWYAWAAREPGVFAGCWRRVHDAVSAVAPGVRWDWSVNRGPSQLGIDPRAAYPGDAYVDIVGVDSYDGWPGAVDAGTWAQHLSGAYGLDFWAAFARAHGKQLSVPEWGVYPGTAWAGHSGGDNAYYIARMFEFFSRNRDVLAYEAYFDEPAPYYAGALALNPRAGAEYRRQVAAFATPPAASPAPPAPTPPVATPPTIAPPTTTPPIATPPTTTPPTAAPALPFPRPRPPKVDGTPRRCGGWLDLLRPTCPAPAWRWLLPFSLRLR